MNINKIIYQSGLAMPVIGLGTFNLYGETAVEAIIKAYEIGYRLIDTATLYINHNDIGRAINKLPRDLLRISSKINEKDVAKYGVKESCEIILSEMRTSYLDVLFLHHPKVGVLSEIIQEMIALKEHGLIRSIGVSNFSRIHLLEIKDFLSFIDVNQIEAHPLLYQPILYQFCHANHIHVMAYRPFADYRLAENKILQDISIKYNKSWRQIVLRWLLQNGMQAIPKASCAQHLQENYDIFDFELSQKEIMLLISLNENRHTCINKFIDYSDI